MKQAKKKAKPKAPVSEEEIASKGGATRRKIITAARRVFACHPYHAASIRMIGEEGGFDYSIIHHYFTKAELFQAVSEQLYGELLTAFIQWLDGLEHLPSEEGLAIYLDRALDYLFEKPDALELLIQNMGHMKDSDPELPGFNFFVRYFREVEAAFLQKNKALAMREEISIWCYTMITLLVVFIGAAADHGKALGMDPRSVQYRKWIKKALLFLFVDPLEEFFRQAREKRRSS